MLLIVCLVLCIIAAIVCTYSTLLDYPRFANWLAHKEVNHVVVKANRWYNRHGININLMVCDYVAKQLDDEKRAQFAEEVLQYNFSHVVRDLVVADCTIIHEWYVNNTTPRYLDHDGIYDELRETLPNIYRARNRYFQKYETHDTYYWHGIIDRLVVSADHLKHSRKERFYKYMITRSVEGTIPLMKHMKCMKEFNNFYKEKFGVDINGE